MDEQDPRSLQPGSLDAMPLSWLHQLVSTLPARDRLALFQSSRPLSRQVVQTSPSVALNLLDQGAGPLILDGTATPTASTRREIITQLLDSCSGFKLKVTSYPHPLLPVAHLPHIKVLEIQDWPCVMSAQDLHNLANQQAGFFSALAMHQKRWLPTQQAAVFGQGGMEGGHDPAATPAQGLQGNSTQQAGSGATSAAPVRVNSSQLQGGSSQLKGVASQLNGVCSQLQGSSAQLQGASMRIQGSSSQLDPVRSQLQRTSTQIPAGSMQVQGDSNHLHSSISQRQSGSRQQAGPISAPSTQLHPAQQAAGLDQRVTPSPWLQCDLSQSSHTTTMHNHLTQSPHSGSAISQDLVKQQTGHSTAGRQQVMLNRDLGKEQQSSSEAGIHTVSATKMGAASTGEQGAVSTAQKDTLSIGEMHTASTATMHAISTAKTGTGSTAQKDTSRQNVKQMVNPTMQHGITCQASPTIGQAEIAWSAMIRLESLSLPGNTSTPAIISLCEALEAGQLPQLHSFTFLHNSAGVPPEVMQRLAHALGPHLTHLHTDLEGLIMHISCMVTLKSICLGCVKLKAAVVKELCELPTLRMVDLQGCSSIEGNHSLSPCGWEVLSINTYNPHVLSVLPLAGLHKIRFVGLARCSNEYYRRGVQAVLQQYREKIVCVPTVIVTSIRRVHEPVFEFWGVYEESVQLAGCLQGVSTVHVCGIVARPPLLRKLWEALPSDVHAVGLFDVSGVNWDHVWDGMPHTITHVDMTSLPWAAMCNLVRTCPTHVKSMAVAVKRLDSALLHSLAPAHVDLKFG